MSVTMARSPRVEVFAAGRGVTAAHVHCDAGPRDRPFAEHHASAAIGVVRRGAFTYHRDGRAHALGPGFLLLGNPGDDFTCSHEHGVGDECVSFVYDEGTLDEVARAVAPRARRRPFEEAFAPPDPRVDALLGCLDAGELPADEAALALAELVLRGPARPRTAPTTRETRARVRDACRFIEEHSAEPIDLEEVAREADMSAFHFLRTFRAVVGVTPHQFLIGARLRRAVALLRNDTIPVTRVAFDAGFGDVSNFINTFRRRLGASPGAFRQRALSFARSTSPI